ncbi:MAG: chalcone isomerase family protein [Gallionellaceae bacterium]
MKKLFLLFLILLTTQAVALEVAGVKLDDYANVADARLQLNGAGVHTMLIFRVYVAGLYLGRKTKNAEVVLEDAGPKRVTLVMKRDQSSQNLVDTFNQGLAANNSPVKLQALDTSIRDLATIFEVVKELEEGDVISIDYIPAFGTRVSINGVEQGRVDGGLEFYNALLRVWLGDNPVDSGLKKELLGG